MRKAHALIAETPKKRSPCSRTRPSLGPETRARQSPLNSSACDASRKQALWRGRFDIAVGQTCASRRNRHRGRNERTERGSPRVTASPRGKVVRDASETEGGHGLRPCEETRAPVGVRTSWQLQKSAGRVLAPNKLVRSAPKRVAVRVNGGLGEGASGTKVSVTSSANGPLVCRPSSLPGCGIGEGPAKAQDDVRASFSGCLARRKAVRWSRDWGCKGHRILRRVLVGGRHLGLSRAISFHEGVVTATLAASSRRSVRARESTHGSEHEGAPPSLRTRERRQRCQRLDCSGRHGKKTPMLQSALRKHGEEARQACPSSMQSAEAFAGVVKHPVPWSAARSPRLRGVSTR